MEIWAAVPRTLGIWVSKRKYENGKKLSDFRCKTQIFKAVGIHEFLCCWQVRSIEKFQKTQNFASRPKKTKMLTLKQPERHSSTVPVDWTAWLDGKSLEQTRRPSRNHWRTGRSDKGSTSPNWHIPGNSSGEPSKDLRRTPRRPGKWGEITGKIKIWNSVNE